MLSKLQNKREQGFTIIEVLIVLAIAGLIMLIVFLAVPALQRNQRNNARTADASRVGAAVNDWVGNHNGAIIVQGDAAAVLTDTGTLNQYPSIAAGNCVADAVQNFCIVAGAQTALAANAQSLNDIRVSTGTQCGTNGATTAATPRQMALQYAVENGAGTATALCINI
jgi:prepilin-type N-terminal cleavage/methylation domain-containing protein